MEASRPRRKYAPRLTQAQRREQVLDAALTVVGGSHLHELSMEAVAVAADVAKPVLYTAFRTRTELVSALLKREHERGIAELRDAMPTDLCDSDPTGAYLATVSTFLQSVIRNQTRWRLILTVPDNAPGDYRDSLRSARTAIAARSESLARTGTHLVPRLARLDPELLGQAMLSFAEMLGRLAARHSDTFPRDRLEIFTNDLMSLLVFAEVPSDLAQRSIASVDDKGVRAAQA